jgi:hypothetical protein
MKEFNNEKHKTLKEIEDVRRLENHVYGLAELLL